MPNILYDGTVVPYGFQVTEGEQYSSWDLQNDYQLLAGEVKSVVYPDDVKSRTKKFLEYVVYVQYRGNGVTQGKYYQGCVVMNALGSKADRSTYTLRANGKVGEDKDNNNLGLGSKVLILLVNGDVGTPVIIGGLPDPTDESQKDFEKDKSLFSWVFNGISVSVNDDGEATVTYTGKSKNDGTTDVEDTVAGSYVKMDKDGNVLVSDKDGKNSLKINHKDGNVEIQRDKKLKIGDADEAFVLGTTYRKQQKQLHTKMQSMLSTLQNLTQQLGTALATAGGKMAVPVSGAVAAATDVAQAGAFAISASQIVKQLGDAVKAFEDAGQQTDYISKKNFADK